MVIYHGSDVIVKEPKILQSNRLLDFGIGFYTTSNIKLFETGVLDKQEALKRLKVEKLFDQISFHTNKGLNFCLFEQYKDLGGDSNG